MEKMDDKFNSILDEKYNLVPKKPIVIGFSGGIDSVCLTSLFMKSSYPLIIAHFNHCLRETADRDEEFSRLFATERKLLFYSERGEVKKFASVQNLSIEEAARKMRYAFLFRVAKENQADTIAVGHHADDQIETVLMHMFRGSGMSGLIGMKPEVIIPEFDRKITIIRPLLTFKRAEIEAYCKKNSLSFVQDETNFSDDYERNRIRNQIFPFLKNYYPGIGERILKLSTLLGDENEFLNDIMDETWVNVCLQDHPEFVRMDRQKFKELDVALQRRIVRKAFFSFDPTLRNLSFDNVEWFINFSGSSKTGEIDLSSNVLAIMNGDEIILGSAGKKWIVNIYPQLDQTYKLDPKTNQVIFLSNLWKIEVEQVKHQPDINDIHEGFIAYLDADYFQGKEMTFRPRKNGDRFQPLGMMNGKIKISDFFINKKLIKVARDKWPLLTTINDEIVWIPGYMPSHSARITNTTKNILKISLLRI